MSLEQTQLEESLTQSLNALVIAKLEVLAKQLKVECTGNARRKATYVIPLVKHMVVNAAALQVDAQYQAYYVGGGGALPKTRTTSEDKNTLDAAAAAKKPVKPTPAYEALMERKLTADPPGRATKHKAVTFAGGEGATVSGPEGAPTTPKRPGKKASLKAVEADASDSELDLGATPKGPPKGPRVEKASKHVKVLIHNLGPGLEEVIVPLAEGVHREVAAPDAVGSTYYVKLDDVLTSMTKHEVASPLKGRNGRLKAFTPAENEDEPRKLRDLGTVDKILGGDVSRLTSLAAMNQHRVVKRPLTQGGSEFELNIVYVPSDIPATTASKSGPVSEKQVPTAPPAAPAPLPKLQLDTDLEFRSALTAYLTSKDVPPWKGPSAEVMSQRLQRYLHVEKAMKVVEPWRTSLRNSAYDIPEDFHDMTLPDCWRWAGGHFTIDAIRGAVGLKHTTASNDLRCFNIPNKISEAAQKRFQPLLDWIKKPEDETLSAKFGKMSQREFDEWRKAALEGKSSDTNKQKLKASGSSKAKGKEKEGKDKKRRRRNDDDVDSESDHRRTKRKRLSSQSLDDDDEDDQSDSD